MPEPSLNPPDPPTLYCWSCEKIIDSDAVKDDGVWLCELCYERGRNYMDERDHVHDAGCWCGGACDSLNY